jgi:hypothetical protein
MAGPERLLDRSSDAEAIERELLGSIRDASPPHGAKDEVWNAVAVQIAAVGAAGVLGAAAAKAGGAAVAGKAGGAVVWGTLLAKIGLGIAVVGSTVTAGVLWVQHAHTSPVAAPSPPALVVPAAANAPAGPVSEPAEEGPLADDRAAAAPGRRVSRTSDVVVSPDPLGRESAVVKEARAKLQSGDPRGTLATLARLRGTGQNAVLVQEREVLTIQALAALGDTQTARRRAQAFVAANPTSPHTPQLRRIADAP